MPQVAPARSSLANKAHLLQSPQMPHAPRLPVDMLSPGDTPSSTGCSEDCGLEAARLTVGGWGGGRGGPGITWVEAGLGVPGGLSPESGRRRRRRREQRLLLASLLPFPSLSGLAAQPDR